MTLAIWLTLGLLLQAPAIAQDGGGGDGDSRRVIYKQRTKLDFDGVSLQGELKNPAEFYFERREEEKFDSLVKRRKNFHREMMRDAVLSK